MQSRPEPADRVHGRSRRGGTGTWRAHELGRRIPEDISRVATTTQLWPTWSPVPAVPARRGTVEQHASEDTDTWDGEESRLWTSWDDGTSGGRIELADFLTTAGLRLAPAAGVCCATGCATAARSLIPFGGGPSAAPRTGDQLPFFSPPLVSGRARLGGGGPVGRAGAQGTEAATTPWGSVCRGAGRCPDAESPATPISRPPGWGSGRRCSRSGRAAG